MMQCVIDRLSEKGHGRATLDGKVVDVKGAFVGELAHVELMKGKRGVKKGILKALETKSADRIPDRCAHASYCGGCNLHGLSYAAQTKIKHEATQKIFNFPVQPIIQAKDPFYYRNKMEFTFSQDKEKNRYLGLIMEDSRGKVFNQTSCGLCPNWMIETLKSVFDHWSTTTLDAYHMPTNSGVLRTLTCRGGIFTKERMVILGLSGNPLYALTHEELEGFKQAILRANKDCDQLSIFVVLTHIEKKVPTFTTEIHLHGKDHYTETLLGKQFCISPQAFFQPNPLQAEVLYQTAFDLLNPTKEDRVLDLYCGVGSIGICLKDRVESVFGIELNRYAVCDAKRNIQVNHLSQVEIVVGDVKEVLEQHKDKPFQVVIVDPPRAGLELKVIETLGQMRASKLLYISCNPKTLARDVPILEAQGYRLKILQPVDQFPQTLHLEMIALFHFEP